MSREPRYSRHFATVVVCLFLLPLLGTLLPAQFHGPVNYAAASAPAHGDWIVTGLETASNTAITLTGNLTVNFGGHLVLDHVDLKMNCSRNGQFNITVKPGGKLDMRNSSVQPVDALYRYRFNFEIEPGAAASINDSALVAIGEANLTKIQTTGLYINSSNVKIIHDVFTMNNRVHIPAVGIVVGPFASPLIEKNDISNFYTTGISFIMGSHSIVRNNTITANAIGVLCLLSQPTFSGNDINGNVVGMQFTASQPSLDGNTVRGSVYTAVSAESSDVVMESNTFSNNIGDLLFNSSSLTDRHMKVSGPNGGINIDHAGSKKVLIENSSLRSTGPTILTINDTVAQTLNTTFDQSKVKITTNSGSLNVYWFLNVSVTMASGAKASGATISVKDAQNATVFLGPGDSEGQLHWLQVQQYLQVGSQKTFKTPDEITATKANLWGNASVDMNSSKTVPIIIDDIKPVVKITQPKDGVLLNKAAVTFKGTAIDNIGLSAVDYKVSSGPWTTATGTDQWNFTVTLPEGTAQVTVRATDRHGLQATAIVNVSIDTIAPSLIISKPVNGTLTNKSTVQVEGKTEAGAHLSFVQGTGGNPQSIPVDANGNFKFVFNLTEGKNDIVLMAQDLAGNQATRSVTMLLDTNPPLLYIYSPLANLITNSSKVVVSGRTDSGGDVTITVNGLPIDVAHNGTFSYDLLLADGTYSIRVSAKDAAGNQVSQLRNVTVKTTKPRIEISSPANNFLTNSTPISVKGRAQAETVWVGILEAKTFPDSENGWWDFNTPYPLKEGSNSIVVKALDIAGNRDTQTVLVILDSTPPILEITEPADGSDTTASMINIVGKTEAGARLTVNGELVGDSDGSFSVPVSLNMGKNTIVIISKDQAGNSAKVTLTVNRQKKAATSLGTYDLWPLVLVILLLCIAVFLLAYGYARSEPKEQRYERKHEAPRKKVSGGKKRKGAVVVAAEEE